MSGGLTIVGAGQVLQGTPPSSPIKHVHNNDDGEIKSIAFISKGIVYIDPSIPSINAKQMSRLIISLHCPCKCPRNPKHSTRRKLRERSFKDPLLAVPAYIWPSFREV